MKQFGIILAALALFTLAATLRVGAVTVTWVSTGTNDWSNTNNWSTTNVPAAGDEVIINSNNVGVLLTNATASLSSILLSNNCTLIFSNWGTSLSATNVWLYGGKVTHETNSATSTNEVGEWVPNARVWIVCSNLWLDGGTIDVSGRGYGSPPWSGTAAKGYGPAGGTLAGGGGHGGFGGRDGYEVSIAGTYGSSNAPVDPGSGAGNRQASEVGTAGGGAVRIQASGTVTLNGTITANGVNKGSGWGGTGAGGSIYIICRTMTGTGGILRANGGAVANSDYGSGGGGRIAMIYNTNAQAGISPVPPILFEAARGTGSQVRYEGDIGTLYFPDGQLLTETMRWNGEILGVASWSPTNLVVSNGTIRFSAAGFRLTVSNDLRIVTNGVLQLGGDAFMTNASSGLNGVCVRYTSTTSAPSLNVGGNLVVTNNGQLYVYSAMTNNTTPDYGSLVSIQGNVIVYSNSWIYPVVSHPTNGSSVRFTLNNLSIYSGGGINADGFGHAAQLWSGTAVQGYGPAGGTLAGGGGHGGFGGRDYYGGSIAGTYGNSNAPIHSGSAAGNRSPSELGTAGGGAVRIQASGTVTLNGTITANGVNKGSGFGGTGAGGSIYIICRTMTGTGGVLRANGGAVASAGYGGGGGGRIAVWWDVRNAQALEERLSRGPMYGLKFSTNPPSSFTGTASVAGGTGGGSAYDGTNGTVLFIQPPPPGTIFTVH